MQILSLSEFMITRPPVRRFRAIAALALVSLAAAGCDRVPLTAPTLSTITLIASTLVVPANGTAELTAVVTEPSGTPVQNGTIVTFTTTLGTIDPAEARTQGGKVTARLNVGGQSGTARVGAFSGSSKATEIELKIGAAAAETISLNAAPAVLPSAGGATTLVATVTDASGNRLPGVPVTFTTTAGTLRDQFVITDNVGEARTVLTTTRSAEVTVAAGSKSQKVTIGLNTAPTATIQMAPNPAIEDQPATFTVTVTPGPNASALRNVVIDFGDGSSQALGPGGGTISHTYRSPGNYTVRVTVTDTSGETFTPATTVVAVNPAAPVNVNMTAAPPTPRVREVVTFTAQVSPATTQVRSYDWDFGDGFTDSTSGNSTTHVYDRVGQKRVTVTVRTIDGQNRSAGTDVVVQPAAVPLRK